MSTLQLAIDSRAARAGAEEARTAIHRVTESARQGQQGVQGLDRGLNQYGQSARTASEQTGTLVGGLGRLTRRAAGLTSVLRGATGAMMGLGGAISAGALFANAVRTIQGFERSMAVLRGVTGATEDQFKSLQETARQMGAQTAFSAQEAAEGMLFLARAGFSVADSIEAIHPTLMLAQAGSLQLGEAADIVSNILSQFRLSTDQTSRAGDVLVRVSNRANTDVRRMAAAMAEVGPIAATLGVEIEETAAAIGALGDAGIPASQAGNALSSILIELSGNVPRVERALERLGLTMDEVNPEKVGILGAFEALSRQNINLADASDLFRKTQAAAGIVLVNSTSRMRELHEEVLAARGSMGEMSGIMGDTLVASFARLRSATEEVMLQTGDRGLTGALRTVVEGFTVLIRHIGGAEDAFNEAEPAAAATGRTIMWLGGAIGTVISLKLVGWLWGGVTAMKAFAVASAGAAAAVSPLLTAIAGVAGMLASFRLGQFFFDEFRTVQLTANNLLTSLESVWVRIKFGFQAAVEAMKTAWAEFVEFVQNLGDRAVEQMTGPFRALGLLPELPARRDRGEFGLPAAEMTGGQFRAMVENVAVSPDVLSRLADDDAEIIREMRQRVFHSWFRGLRSDDGLIPLEDIQEMSAAVDRAARTLQRQNEPGLRRLGEQLMESFESGLEGAHLPLNWRVSRLRQELQDELERIEAVRLQREREIAEAFPDGERRRADLSVSEAFIGDVGDGIADGLNRLKDRLQPVIQAITGVDPERRLDLQIDRELDDFFGDDTGPASRPAPSRPPSMMPGVDDGEEAAGQLDRMLENLQRQQSLLGLTNDQLIEAEARHLAVVAAKQDGVDVDDERIERIVQETRRLNTLTERYRRLEAVGDGVGNSFADAFGKMVLGAESAGAAIEALGEELVALLTRRLILDQVASFISQGVQSFAGGFTGGGAAPGPDASFMAPQPFADGAVFNSPHHFPLGMMGEAGPEAIMPLGRTPSGGLGVIAAGGAGLDRAVDRLGSTLAQSLLPLRELPRTAGADTGRGGGAVEVNIINQSGAAQVEAYEEAAPGPGGGKRINVIVADMAASDVRQNGPLAQAISQTYGLTRRGVRR